MCKDYNSNVHMIYGIGMLIAFFLGIMTGSMVTKDNWEKDVVKRKYGEYQENGYFKWISDKK